jgi:hypothetical protein
MPSSRYGLQMLSQCCLLPSSIRKGTCVHRAAGRPILDALRACLPRSITYISDICLMVSKWWRLVAEGQGMVAGDTSGESPSPTFPGLGTRRNGPKVRWKAIGRLKLRQAEQCGASLWSCLRKSRRYLLPCHTRPAPPMIVQFHTRHRTIRTYNYSSANLQAGWRSSSPDDASSPWNKRCAVWLTKAAGQGPRRRCID